MASNSALKKGRAEVQLPRAVEVGGGVVLVLSFLYAAFTRTLADFMASPPLYIAGSLVLVALVAVVTVAVTEGLGKFSFSWIAVLVGLLLFSAAAGVFYYGVGLAIKDAYLWWGQHTFSRLEVIYLAPLVTGIVGGALFWLRLRLRSTYGMTEVVAGLLVSTFKVTAEDTTSFLQRTDFYIAFLTAGIYLVVRGLDNVHQGLTKDEHRDPLFACISGRLRGLAARFSVAPASAPSS